jgi:hypothetical protein
MVLDERSRHELYLKLEEVLGSQQATTLMEMLPPVGWADVATKRDVDALAVATKRDLDQLEQRIDLRFEAFEHRLRAAFANQTRTIVLAMTGINLALAFGIASLT